MKQAYAAISIRPASESLYLPALDGLRLIAFLLVFIHHAPALLLFPIFIKIRSYGWIGVELFFVISAFLFFHLFSAEYEKTRKINIRRFYIRRLLRIYPLMIAFPALMMLIFWKGMSLKIFYYFSSLGLFFSNYFMWTQSSPVLFTGHLWTLSFEFQIYLIIPFAFALLVHFGSRRFMLGLTVVFAICLGLRLLTLALGTSYKVIWMTPLLRPESILLGLLLSLGFFKRGPSWCYMIIFVVAGLCFLQVPLPRISFLAGALSYPLAALMCGSLVVLALRWNPLNRMCSWKPIRFLGSISFGLYVYHLLGIDLTGQLFKSLGLSVTPANSVQDWGLFFVISLLLTISMAVLSYYGFERMFLRLKDRFAVVHGR